MAVITVRNVDEEVKKRLRVKAAAKGVSMEEEARTALAKWVDATEVKGEDMFTRLRRRAEALGGIELDIPPRTGGMRPLPSIFDEEE